MSSYLEFAAKVSAVTSTTMTIVSTVATDPASAGVTIGTFTLSTLDPKDTAHFIAGDTINIRINNNR